MKNTIIKYGLISGAISAALMLIMFVASKPDANGRFNFDNAALYGYTSILIAMAVIFFGVKAYRDKINDGKVSIGKALLMGLGITAISCVCYSLMWMVIYYNFMPNFIDDYASYSLEKLKASGADATAIAKNQEEMDSFRNLYKTPFGVFAITLIEPLPVGVIVSLVTSLILKRK